MYGAYDASYLNASGPKQATQSPVVTGTSVIGVKFKDGVVMAADNLGKSRCLRWPRLVILLSLSLSSPQSQVSAWSHLSLTSLLTFFLLQPPTVPSPASPTFPACEPSQAPRWSVSAAT